MEPTRFTDEGNTWEIGPDKALSNQGASRMLMIRNITSGDDFVLYPRKPEAGNEIDDTLIAPLQNGQMQMECIDPESFSPTVRSGIVDTLTGMLREDGFTLSAGAAAEIMCQDTPLISQDDIDAANTFGVISGVEAVLDTDSPSAAQIKDMLTGGREGKGSHAEKFKPPEGGHRGAEDARNDNPDNDRGR